MPLYEYECQGCGEIFEVLQKCSDPPPAKHSCGSCEIRRLMSPAAFVFKGSGWYVTDYARKDGSNPNNGKERGRDKQDSKQPANSATTPDSKEGTKEPAKKETSAASEAKTAGSANRQADAA